MRFPKFLKIGIVTTDNLFTWDNVSGPGAVEGNLLIYLSQALRFSYEVVLEPEGNWGSADARGVGTGLIGMVQRGEVDMGLSFLAITDRRDMAVSFSYPYTVMERTFATEKPGFVDKFAAFTFPFSAGVWIGCLCTLIAAAFVFQRVVYKDSKKSYLDMLILALGSLLSQSTREPNKGSRLVYSTWLAGATIIPFVYSALLLSFLTLPIRERGVRTFQELSSAVMEGKIKALAPYGSLDLELLQTSEIPYVRRLGNAIKQNGWLFRTQKDHMKDLMNTSTALVSPKQLLVMRIGYGPFLEKFICDEYFGTWHVGVTVSKSFCCKRSLDRAILRLLTAGLHKKWFDEEAFVASLRGRTLHQEDEGDDPLGPLSIEDLKGVFLLWIIGQGFALIVLMAEIVAAKISCKKVVIRHRKQSGISCNGGEEVDRKFGI